MVKASSYRAPPVTTEESRTPLQNSEGSTGKVQAHWIWVPRKETRLLYRLLAWLRNRPAIRYRRMYVRGSGSDLFLTTQPQWLPVPETPLRGPCEKKIQWALTPQVWKRRAGNAPTTFQDYTEAQWGDLHD